MQLSSTRLRRRLLAVIVTPRLNVSNASHGGAGFGAIFMSDYIEHVRDPRTVLAIAARRLIPRGAVVIMTPNLGSIPR
jgi:2-polyprenyl-3-methyl-5-hydroxy-6-metoxy-1,4-benzoquinol methylase